MIIISKLRSCISHFTWHNGRKVAGGQCLFTLIEFHPMRGPFVLHILEVLLSYTINVVPSYKDHNIIILTLIFL